MTAHIPPTVIPKQKLNKNKTGKLGGINMSEREKRIEITSNLVTLIGLYTSHALPQKYFDIAKNRAVRQLNDIAV